MNILSGKVKIKSNLGSIFWTNMILVFGVLLILLYYLFSSPIRNKDIIIHIAPNDSLTEISEQLESKKIVANSYTLRLFILVLMSDKNIDSGDYLFKKRESFISVTWRIVRGIHKTSPLKITLREGITVAGMSTIFADKIPNFRKDIFLADNRSKEGYLFPDTYFIYPLSTTEEILDKLSSNFNNKIKLIKKDIESSEKSFSDILIMASIIEAEASGKNDAKMISGILWKRIKLGMYLQVDAVPSSYKKIGLPKLPINNPGLSSILAAVYPTSSSYLYYLHDSDRVIHYAKTFAKHKKNIYKYLK